MAKTSHSQAGSILCYHTSGVTSGLRRSTLYTNVHAMGPSSLLNVQQTSLGSMVGPVQHEGHKWSCSRLDGHGGGILSTFLRQCFVCPKQECAELGQVNDVVSTTTYGFVINVDCHAEHAEKCTPQWTWGVRTIELFFDQFPSIHIPRGN